MSTFLDNLITYHRTTVQEKRTTSASEKNHEDKEEYERITPFETWDEFFEEMEKLPEAPELSSMTKQQRKDLITEYLLEKYKGTSLDLS